MPASATQESDRGFLRELCNLEIPSDIKISPSGETVVYSTSLTWGHLKGKLPVTTLWLATLGEAYSSKKITDGSCRDHSPAWFPHGSKLAFISDRAGNATKSAIYSMATTDLGNAVAITSTENEQAIEKFKISGDGKLIAFISKDEKTAEEKQREQDQEDVEVWGQGYRLSRLRVLNLESGQVTTLALEEHLLDLCWHPTKQELGFVTSKNTLIECPYYDGTTLYTVGADLKLPKKLCSCPTRANDLVWGDHWGERSDLYFWAGVPAGSNFGGSGLYRVDTTGTAPAECELIDLGDDRDVVAVRAVEGKVFAKIQNRFEDQLVWVTDGGHDVYSCKQEIEAFDLAFEFSDGSVGVVIATSDVNSPIEVYSKFTGSINARDEMVRLSRHGAAFQDQTFGACIFLSCPTSDEHDLDIDAVFLTPASAGPTAQSSSAPTAPHPTIVLIHGGPLSRVTNAFNALYYMWTPYLLRQGYAVLLPNYRGSSGRGADFGGFSLNGGVSQYSYADVIALTQHAVAQGLADADRLVVGGYSHGGLLTNLCAVRNGAHDHAWAFRAAFSGAGISDVDAMGLTSDMGVAYQGQLNGGRLPWTMAADDTSTRAASALWEFAEAVERGGDSKGKGAAVPPMLVFHGAADERCPVSQAWGLRRALEHYALPFELAVYPRQAHIFHEQGAWVDMGLRIGRWVERYIGGAREAAAAAATLPVRSA